MKVRELTKRLEEFDPEMIVTVGIYQKGLPHSIAEIDDLDLVDPERGVEIIIDKLKISRIRGFY